MTILTLPSPSEAILHSSGGNDFFLSVHQILPDQGLRLIHHFHVNNAEKLCTLFYKEGEEC